MVFEKSPDCSADAELLDALEETEDLSEDFDFTWCMGGCDCGCCWSASGGAVFGIVMASAQEILHTGKDIEAAAMENNG